MDHFLPFCFVTGDRNIQHENQNGQPQKILFITGSIIIINKYQLHSAVLYTVQNQYTFLFFFCSPSSSPPSSPAPSSATCDKHLSWFLFLVQNFHKLFFSYQYCTDCHIMAQFLYVFTNIYLPLFLYICAYIYAQCAFIQNIWFRYLEV